MTALLRLLALTLCLAAASSPFIPAVHAAETVDESDLTSIPMGKGLPVTVRVGVMFHEVGSFTPDEGAFEAITDLRLSWEDPRLRYPAKEAPRGYKESVGSAAEDEIAKIWTPRVSIVNRPEDASFTIRRLRIYPDGRVETIARATAGYKTPVDLARFPFDRQNLNIEVALREDVVESVDLDFSPADVAFSRAAQGVEIGGWEIGLVNLRRDLVKGWNGDRYAKVTASLSVRRDAAGAIATIFIPLFASLLIPFMATWMNRIEDGAFAVDAFELANVIIGGLFAVIALSFTISSTYPTLAEGDNTVTQLLGLNYVALAVGLLIAVFLYRYNLPKRWFGAHVQEEVFLFLTWAFPLVSLVVGAACIAAAAA